MKNENRNLRLIIDSLEDSKAKNIKAIDIRNLTTIAYYFVIASGTSVTHIKALNDNLVKKLSENGLEPLRIEGYNHARWILLTTVILLYTSSMKKTENTMVLKDYGRTGNLLISGDWQRLYKGFKYRRL